MTASIGPNFFVYIPGQIKRDEAKIKGLAAALNLSPYEAKIMLGAPGPRKVAAHSREEDAQAQALALRQADIAAFVVDKGRFSRLPKVLKAVRAVEDPGGLTFTIEAPPAPGEVQARAVELPQPKGSVKGVVLGFYTQTTTHKESSRAKVTMAISRTQVQEPFIHLYSEDPHTLVEIRGPKFEFAWLQSLTTLSGNARLQKLAQLLANYYGAVLDATLFNSPAEVNGITAALNVDASTGIAGAGVTTSARSSDDAPLAMAASRIIVYSRVFGL